MVEVRSEKDSDKLEFLSRRRERQVEVTSLDLSRKDPHDQQAAKQ